MIDATSDLCLPLCTQAPNWNAIVKKFAGNPDVVFGDVNLSKNQVRIGSPGAGGWPTLRYFNKGTGYEGEAVTPIHIHSYPIACTL